MPWLVVCQSITLQNRLYEVLPVLPISRLRWENALVLSLSVFIHFPFQSHQQHPPHPLPPPRSARSPRRTPHNKACIQITQHWGGRGCPSRKSITITHCQSKLHPDTMQRFLEPHTTEHRSFLQGNGLSPYCPHTAIAYPGHREY